ncbi:MAG TPA: RDD family protein [Acidisarcina sp.]
MSTSPSTVLPNVETAAAWKQEVNDRLAAHRTRRTRRGDDHPTLPGLETHQAQEHLKSSIAAKVAARYANAPTYSEILAAEAQNAASAAAVAAKAAGEAHAAAQAILTGLDLGRAHTADELPNNLQTPKSAARAEQFRQSRAETALESGRDTGSETRREPWQDTHPVSGPSPSPAVDSRVEKSTIASDGVRITLAERTSEDDLEVTPQPISANLIEFPRELVATRRARPRAAEGPLREEPGHKAGRPQLRIFEVEPDSISNVATQEPNQTEWASIRLGAHPMNDLGAREDARAHTAHKSAAAGAHAAAASRLELPLQTASLEDRTMGAVVDFVVVTAAFLLFVLAFVACSAVPPMGKGVLMSGVTAYFVMAVGYQLLFFAFAESTPGMRYAKIALCTFDDENPTPRQMRIRIAAMLLSLCPLGLGCAWVFFDEDHLSWHDRITRTYQRSYR